jgi:chromosome segregation protein
VYEDAGRAIADASDGEGAILAVAIAADTLEPALRGERSLMSAVKPDARVEGLVASILRDVYLARDTRDAAEKHQRHPQARFVTSDGVMVGREIIQTAPEAGTRARSIGEELSGAEAGIAEARNLLGPIRERLEDIDSELQSVAADLGSADAGITSAAERLTHLERDLASARKEEEILTQRLAGMDEAAAAWRENLAAAEADPQSLTELPAMPAYADPPIGARVAVETLRRDRTTFEARLESLRDELSALAAETPELIRATAEAAETSRQAAQAQFQLAEEGHAAALAARDAAGAAERAATGAENDANREWREAAAQLDSLREEYEEEDRARGDLDRRIADAELLIREGHSRDPGEALAALTDDDTVPVIERKAELVQRRLQLLGRVNLLASGEFEAIQERHDFLARELDDVKKARRDLFDVIRRVDEEVIQLFEAAFRDVAATFEVMFKDLFPGGEGRLVLTDPADLLNTGIEVEARPGRKRVSGDRRADRLAIFRRAVRPVQRDCWRLRPD